ncbi:MAG: hypothetical protein JWP87_5666, partial [Labilithrix sp.]|nr:hypothetical protein [Labilithrix sp.]
MTDALLTHEVNRRKTFAIIS